MCSGLEEGQLLIRNGLNTQLEAKEYVGSTQCTVAENASQTQTAVFTKNKTTKN